ncbi:hypothetical protein HS088_TW15G00414 [Tripterygium wilfordii]|uniref:Uncharacterized protein n=1 Tax=Tripterygium wilfordii TaxID=458696 RepID=A0A7J7CLG2_TRIWF|nr:hypothetical protein HS088_TW15G00414 [Tripterygium wilfordii]
MPSAALVLLQFFMKDYLLMQKEVWRMKLALAIISKTMKCRPLVFYGLVLQMSYPSWISRVLQSSKLLDMQSDKLSPSIEESGSQSKFQSISTPYSRRVVANPASTPSSNNGLLKDSARSVHPNAYSKRVQLDKDDRRWNVVPADEATDISWSNGEKGSVGEDRNANGGPRWRSDETSDEEVAQSLERAIGVGSRTTPRSRTRRRFTRR